MADQFVTTSLTDASFLLAEGNPVRLRALDGSLVAFHFDDLSAAAAGELLSSRDAANARNYHRSLTKLRKSINALVRVENRP